MGFLGSQLLSSSFIDFVHGRAIHERRTRVLAKWISPWLVGARSVVDVGCGDAKILKLLSQNNPDCSFQGFEVFLRPRSEPLFKSGREIGSTEKTELEVPIRVFDGNTLPLADQSIDDVLLIDVLHHSNDPAALLKEALRITRRQLIIKDHLLNKPGAKFILSFMDWVSNGSKGVALPYHYWGKNEWKDNWKSLGLIEEDYHTELGLYPPWAAPVFESGLQFLARLSRGQNFVPK